MTFQQSIRTCFSKYVTFSGRATRSEFWWFTLFLFLGSAIAGVLDTSLFGWDGGETTTNFTGTEFETGTSYQSGPLGSIFALVTFLPYIAVGWRRMHDTGRAGYMLFYPVLVMIGIGIWLALYGNSGVIGGPLVTIAFIVLIISPFLVIWWLTRPTQPEPNEYGPVPVSIPA